MEPAHPTGDGPWDRPRSRREILQLGVVLAAGAAVTPLLAACGSSAASAPGASAGSGGGLSGPITVITGGGDPTAEPALKRVYDGFKALHPGIEWDIRALTGGGPEWDRLARATVTSGEPVGLVMIDGQQVRGWIRDGLLADLGADPRMAARPRPRAGPLPPRRFRGDHDPGVPARRDARASTPRASSTTRRCSIARRSRLRGRSRTSRRW